MSDTGWATDSGQVDFTSPASSRTTPGPSDLLGLPDRGLNQHLEHLKRLCQTFCRTPITNWECSYKFCRKETRTLHHEMTELLTSPRMMKIRGPQRTQNALRWFQNRRPATWLKHTSTRAISESGKRVALPFQQRPRETRSVYWLKPVSTLCSCPWFVSSAPKTKLRRKTGRIGLGGVSGGPGLSSTLISTKLKSCSGTVGGPGFAPTQLTFCAPTPR